MAHTLIGISPCAVIKIIGIWLFAAASFALKLKPAQTWQTHVQHQTGRAIRCFPAEKFFRRGKHFDAAIRPIESNCPTRRAPKRRRPQRTPSDRTCLSVTCVARFTWRLSLSDGKVKPKSCARTVIAFRPQTSAVAFDNRAADGKPHAEPSGLVVKNVSKIRAIFSGGRPTPESRTVTSTASFPFDLVSIRRGAGGPNTVFKASRAFIIRLSKTCCNCTRSAKDERQFTSQFQLQGHSL